MLSLTNLTLDEVKAIKASLLTSTVKWQEDLEDMQRFVSTNPLGMVQMKDISSEMATEYRELKSRIQVAKELDKKF